MRLNHKVAVVTGAASGIGRAIAETFAGEGAYVVLADRDAAAGAAMERNLLSAGREALFVQTDVADEEQVARMAEAAAARHGAIDVLVNNAGVMVQGNAVETSAAEWVRSLSINLTGAWLCAKHVIPRMRTPGAAIVNIGSTHPTRTQPGHMPYTVAKGGLLALTTSLAVDFGPLGIRANCICPGFIETAMSAPLIARWQADGTWPRVLARQPLGRIGTPADVANAALFLASGEAAFITGATLVVDGGRLAYAHGPVQAE